MNSLDKLATHSLQETRIQMALKAYVMEHHEADTDPDDITITGFAIVPDRTVSVGYEFDAHPFPVDQKGCTIGEVEALRTINSVSLSAANEFLIECFGVDLMQKRGI